MSHALRITKGEFGRVALLDMDRSLVRHAHPHCHVLLKIDGDDTQFAVGDRVAPLTDTLAVLINAWETHAYVHDPARRNSLILALYIEPRWLCAFRPNWVASATPGFFDSATGVVDARIQNLSRDLVAEMIHAPEPSAAKEILLSDLMIAVIDRFTPWRSVGGSLWDRARTATMDRRIRRAIGAMRADPANGASMAQIAKSAGLSRAHFFRMFERSTGVTPHVFLNVLKVECAVNQVAASDASLTLIGADLGFGSPAHFSRFFRDHVSVAPSEFRAVLRF